jgi:hypothetical protein
MHNNINPPAMLTSWEALKFKFPLGEPRSRRGVKPLQVRSRANV